MEHFTNDNIVVIIRSIFKLYPFYLTIIVSILTTNIILKIHTKQHARHVKQHYKHYNRPMTVTANRNYLK